MHYPVTCNRSTNISIIALLFTKQVRHFATSFFYNNLSCCYIHILSFCTRKYTRHEVTLCNQCSCMGSASGRK